MTVLCPKAHTIFTIGITEQHKEEGAQRSKIRYVSLGSDLGVVLMEQSPEMRPVALEMK